MRRRLESSQAPARRSAGWPSRRQLAALFASPSLCVPAIVWPHADRNYDVDPQALLVAHPASGDPSPIGLASDLIASVAIHHRLNARRLAQMSSAVRIGAGLLAIRMVLTVVAATGPLGVLYRDLPPRRTLRGRARALVWWRRPVAGDDEADARD